MGYLRGRSWAGCPQSGGEHEHHEHHGSASRWQQFCESLDTVGCRHPRRSGVLGGLSGGHDFPGVRHAEGRRSAGALDCARHLAGLTHPLSPAIELAVTLTCFLCLGFEFALVGHGDPASCDGVAPGFAQYADVKLLYLHGFLQRAHEECSPADVVALRFLGLDDDSLPGSGLVHSDSGF